MRRLFVMLGLALGLLYAAPAPVAAKVSIFACEPEWAALAKEVGGERVRVRTATTAHQDPHHIRARPSLIAAVRRADIVFCSGAGLEVGWLPLLLQQAGKRVQPGQAGHLMAADHVRVLDKPVLLDRSLGDIHPEGNPHVHLDPENILKVSLVLRDRLKAVDEGNVAYYEANWSAFSGRWMEATAEWNARAQALRGMPVIVHHEGWSYLIDWLGLEEIASLEPKPGIPPTTAHLEFLLKTVREKKAAAIIRGPSNSPDASEWLSDKSGILAIVLPYTIGGDDEATDLFSLFDRTLFLLTEARNDKR